jgi:transcription antitermination factor NusG
LAAGAALVDDANKGLLSLLPIYRFVAWSRDNDFVSMREALQKEKQQKRQKGLAKNDAVRIIRGMFAGKQGVVQEVDAKGGLRVLVGKVAVKLDAEDVQKS